MMTLFSLTLDQVAILQEVCEKLNLKTEEEITLALIEMAKMGKVKGMWETKRTKAQIVADFAKQFNVSQPRVEENKG